MDFGPARHSFEIKAKKKLTIFTCLARDPNLTNSLSNQQPFWQKLYHVGLHGCYKLRHCVVDAADGNASSPSLIGPDLLASSVRPR